mgnify:CR=1 FL=1
MRHDPALDAMHFQQRDHRPTLNAWMQDEPAGYVDTLNAYNAPADTNHSRPTGITQQTGRKPASVYAKTPDPPVQVPFTRRRT